MGFGRGRRSRINDFSIDFDFTKEQAIDYSKYNQKTKDYIKKGVLFYY